MNGLSVLIAPPTDAGRLFPHYDRESGVLTVESRVKRPWPIGVDIDGSVVFDLDADRRLTNIDILIPADRWTEGVGPLFAHFPPAGDLLFTQETVLVKSFSRRIRVSKDTAQNLVHVQIESHPTTQLVALSNACVAHVSESTLVAFTLFGVP